MFCTLKFKKAFTAMTRSACNSSSSQPGEETKNGSKQGTLAAALSGVWFGNTTVYLLLHDLCLLELRTGRTAGNLKAVLPSGTGSVSGAIISTCVQPLDVVRTRMQADATKNAFSGMLGTFRSIVSEEGVRYGTGRKTGWP